MINLLQFLSVILVAMKSLGTDVAETSHGKLTEKDFGLEKIEVTSWSNFKSEHGFQMRVPECWEAIAQADEDETRPAMMKDFFLGETKKCSSPRWAKDMPNGFSVFVKHQAKPPQINENFGSPRNPKFSRLGYLDFGLLTFPNHHVYRYIQTSGTLRWSQVVWCQGSTISIQGGAIEPIPKNLVDRMANEGWLILEPFKTIFDSVECIPPTYKPKATPTPAPKKKPPQKK